MSTRSAEIPDSWSVEAPESQSTETLPPWQQYVSYSIDCTLDDQLHELHGDWSLTYTNNSPDTLRRIFIHLWPNAYRSDQSALGRQLFRTGNTSLTDATTEERGGIDSLSFTIDGQAVDYTNWEGNLDVIEIALPAPLLPRESIQMATPFRLDIPASISRLGHVGQSYQMTQWYPKPAVYDQDGWHPMPYLDNGEFYSEFGDFTVRIELPTNYKVAATGTLETQSEKDRLIASSQNLIDWLKSDPEIGLSYQKADFPPSSDETKTLTYKAENVHDFAWFADKRFKVMYDTLHITGREDPVEVWSFFTEYTAAWWYSSIEYLKASTRFYSKHVGPYPYPTVAAAQSPLSEGGGMEYPMITLIGTEYSQEDLDEVIAHEVGHNWFYGILASNERDHAWMDEGINSYYEGRYMAERYPDQEPWLKLLGRPLDDNRLSQDYAAGLAIDQPPATTSEQLSYDNYWLSAYTKPQLAFEHLEKQVGRDALDKAIQLYYERFAFRHPQPDDLRKSLEESLDRDLSQFFDDYIFGTVPVPFEKADKRPLKLTFFSGQEQADYRQLHWTPWLGFNANDGALLGLGLHNRHLAASKFEWGLMPGYGFESQELVGMAGLRYRSLRPFKRTQQLVSHLAIQRFSDREIRGDAYGYERWSAGTKLIFDHPPITERQSHLSLTYVGLNRNRPTFDSDGEIVGDESNQNHFIDLHYSRSLDREIDPSSYSINLGYRTAQPDNPFDTPTLLLEADWRASYEYERGKKLAWRLYAGYFLINDFRDRNVSNEFRLALIDNANADYRYEDLYLGRGQTGFYEQQLEQRQGGMRAPVSGAFNLGRSNDYLVAFNLDSDLPFAPAGFPFGVYLDAGVFGLSPIQRGQLENFQWAGGLSFSILDDALGVYLPLFGSPELRDRIQERGGVLNRIAFRLSLDKLMPWKLIDRIGI
ncbi:MAG: M1 family metallopeptidase [Bacteroidota bacterium]